MSEPQSTQSLAKQEIVEANSSSHRVSAGSQKYLAFSGPIPHPEILAGYEKACPGLADRIVRMAEQEAEHRRETERSIIESAGTETHSRFIEARIGQLCALVITLAALSFGTFLVSRGHEWAGSVLGVGGIGSIVAAFMRQRIDEKTDSVEKTNSPPSPPNRKSNHKKHK